MTTNLQDKIKKISFHLRSLNGGKVVVFTIIDCCDLLSKKQFSMSIKVKLN